MTGFTDLFHRVENAQTILRSRGVYRQVAVYRRDKKIFAKHGNGFIQLSARNTTSHPDITWLGIDSDAVNVDAYGVPFFNGNV